mgnify:FL=1
MKPLVAAAEPGEIVPVDLVFRSYDAGRWIHRVMVAVPAGFPEGLLTLTAGGGRGLGRTDLPEPVNMDLLLDRLESYEPSNMLVLYGLGDGGRNLEVEGGILPALPPSLRKIQSGLDRASTGFTQTETMDATVFGRANAQIMIRRK